MLTLTDTASLIIGIVRNQATFDMITRQHQYYLPIRYLPLVADARLLACYMPAWYRAQPHHITHVAQLRDYTIQPRHLIWPAQPHHPRADQLYVVLSLHTLTTLTPAIPSPRWRRVGVHRTTAMALARLPFLGYRGGLYAPHTTQMSAGDDLLLW